MKENSFSFFVKRKKTGIVIFLTAIFIGLYYFSFIRFWRSDSMSTGNEPNINFDKNRAVKNIETYLESVRAPNGLTRSFTDTSAYIFAHDTGTFYLLSYGQAGYLEDQAFIYDLSLAVIGFILLDQPEKAEKILDILEEDFYLEKNGNTGLYNSYRVSSNLPYDELALGSDGDRLHTGPMLWVALAAINHMKLEKTTRYLNLILDMVNWCRYKLDYYRFPDGGRGGVSMGFGWGPDWSKIYITEHNVDYYAVLKMLRTAFKEYPKIRPFFEEKKIDLEWIEEEMQCVERFLFEVVFSEESYCFIAGVNHSGLDTTRILDGTTWGIAGVGPEVYEKWGIDLDRLIESTEKRFHARYPMPDGTFIEGMDITDFEGTGKKREALVWFEGTGQHIIALGELARYFHKKGNQKKAQKYKEKAISYMNDMFNFSDYFGLDGALPYMAAQPKRNQIVTTLQWEWEIPRGKDGKWVKSMSSCMWFLYALEDLHNPMKW